MALNRSQTTTFGSTTVSVAWQVPIGDFNISCTGLTAGDASVAVQRSFDGGSTWYTIESFTADIQKRAFEPEPGVQWRFNCTWTSGAIVCRFSAIA